MKRFGTMGVLAAAALLLGCNGGQEPAYDYNAGDADGDITASSMEQAASSKSPFIGQPAPGFTLLNSNGDPIRLADYRGQWLVLYFYPEDDTPGCICEATDFTDLLFRFKDMNADIVGVNADSPASHRAFKKKHALGITLLSDPDKDVLEKYGAWDETVVGGKRHGRIIRSTFIIDPQGIIRYHWPEVIPEGHAKRVRQRLETLQRG